MTPGTGLRYTTSFFICCCFFFLVRYWPLTSANRQCPTPQRPPRQAPPTRAWVRLQLRPRRTLWPWSAGDVRRHPLHLCLPRVSLTAALDCPPPPPSALSDLILPPPNGKTDSTRGLNVNRWYQSLRLIHPEQHDGTFLFTLHKRWTDQTTSSYCFRPEFGCSSQSSRHIPR